MPNPLIQNVPRPSEFRKRIADVVDRVTHAVSQEDLSASVQQELTELANELSSQIIAKVPEDDDVFIPKTVWDAWTLWKERARKVAFANAKNEYVKRIGLALPY